MGRTKGEKRILVAKVPLFFALSRDNHIEARAERAKFGGNGIPRFAPHDDCVAHRVRRRGGCGLFEKGHVAGQAPRQLARAANAAVGRGGDDDREASHGAGPTGGERSD